MSRQGDQKDWQKSAVFQTSRRVAFVARAAVRSPRFASDRASRDPMTSLEIDVHNAIPSTPSVLGLESDWSGVLQSIGSKKAARFSLQASGSTGSFAAHIAIIEHAAFLLPGDFEAAGDLSTHLMLDHELYDLLAGRKGALEIQLAPPHETKFISFSELSERLPHDDGSRHPEPEQPAVTGTPAIREPDNAADTNINTAERLRALTSPKTFPASLKKMLSHSLGSIDGAFETALLFQAEYVDGHSEYLIGLCGAEEHLVPSIEATVNRALTEFEDEVVELGIAFFDADDPMVIRISRVGLILA